MSTDIKRLERRIAQLEREVKNLQSAAAPSQGASNIYVVASESDTRKISIAHDDIASPYQNAAGYLNMAKTDPNSSATGIADVGYWGKSDVFSAHGYWAGGAYLFMRNGGSTKVVVDYGIDNATYGVAVRFAHFTTTERNAMTPASGWTIYNSTTNKLQTYNGSTWNDLY